MYTINLSVTDNQTGDVLMQEQVSAAQRSDVFVDGEDTPSTVQVARFLLSTSAQK
jgi:hypothetical protein